MKVNNFLGQIHQYQVATEIFTGPLDLLLLLIEREELDVTKLSLSKVTNQFLEYLNSLTSYSAEDISGFLVVAAKLIQIKSEALLPRTTSQDRDKEDVGDALIQQLIRYKQFKNMAEALGDRQQQHLRSYLRIYIANPIDAPLNLNLTLDDLVSAARQVYLRRAMMTVEHVVKILPPRITIRQKILLIARYLRDHERVSFRQILDNTISRLDMAVSFLAVLELVKQHLVEVYQPGLFGEIEITPSESWNDHVDIELEFGD